MLHREITKNIMKCNIQNAKKNTFLLAIFILFFTLKTFPNNLYNFKKDSLNITQNKTNIFNKNLNLIEKIKSRHDIKKGYALLILLFTGPLGGHRIYLGTAPYVPLVYTATLGGGFGFLPLLDAIAIIFSNKIDKFINNEKIIMWI